MLEIILERFNYVIYILLMMIGLYAMVAKNNMVKKLIGMSIFQTAIMLFYVSIGAKKGATIPILTQADKEAADLAHKTAEASVQASEPASQALEHGAHAADAAHHSLIEAANYVNPLPHVLMLTAIVVGVATLGVAMAVLQKIYAQYGTIEEDEVMEKLTL